MLANRTALSQLANMVSQTKLCQPIGKRLANMVGGIKLCQPIGKRLVKPANMVWSKKIVPANRKALSQPAYMVGQIHLCQPGKPLSSRMWFFCKNCQQNLSI